MGELLAKNSMGSYSLGIKKIIPELQPPISYFEYLMARYKTFLFQNDRDQHSWLFFFDRFHEIPSLPQWFIKWWSHLEAELKILPPFY